MVQSVEVNTFEARAQGDVPRLFTKTFGFRFFEEDGRLVHRVLMPGQRGYGIVAVTSTGHEAGFVETDRTALTLPFAGHSEVCSGGRRHVVTPADAIIVGPSERKSRLVAEPKTGLYESLTILIPNGLCKVTRDDEVLELRHADPRCGDLRSLLGVAFSISELDGHRARRKLDLIEALVEEMLIDIFGRLPGPPGRQGSTGSDAAIVATAHDVMRHALSEAVTMAEIATEVGVTQRQLQNAFRARLGVTPRSHLTALRLRDLRHRLETADARTTVTQVALDAGLAHLGRCSVAYKARFGETPSETLARARRNGARQPLR